ncbi:hypothetical protein [Massilia brevitalea]|uniref:hypothetical protein n=1 Tax=Massilia brevitalea TaxID=442526 RepID=UPI0027399366|nr:hypothetical protein [Massilia brevitalea]
MHLRNNELDEACLALARILLARHNSVSHDILDTVTTRLQQDAARHADYVQQLGRDPNMVTRAVLYLNDTHAHPELGSDTAWFRPMLACLLELAAPSLALSSAGAAFLRDVEEGVAQSIADNDAGM